MAKETAFLSVISLHGALRKLNWRVLTEDDGADATFRLGKAFEFASTSSATAPSIFHSSASRSPRRIERIPMVSSRSTRRVMVSSERFDL
ncbi:MAG: hypothetical protein BWY85_01297 [Firmicutes bacterium ADurb.Bin506]|nr:MAG: hypothetical protein BWY85_01297 [Firmicutes bacterium ADurb.Bin506]